MQFLIWDEGCGSRNRVHRMHNGCYSSHYSSRSGDFPVEIIQSNTPHHHPWGNERSLPHQWPVHKVPVKLPKKGISTSRILLLGPYFPGFSTNFYKIDTFSEASLSQNLRMQFTKCLSQKFRRGRVALAGSGLRTARVILVLE